MSTTPTPAEVDVETFAAEHAEHAEAQVVDVREPMEYAAGHVAGALLVPLGQLPAQLPALAARLDRARPVYVICASGHRSLVGAEVLRHQGFDAVSVAGGTHGWVATGRPVDVGLS